jgi:phage terminase large subunit-like protein
VDVKAIASRAERDRVKDHFRNNLMNLLEPDGRFWGLCTPWHRDDLNAELKRSASYPLFRKAVDEDLNPVWPARWPKEALAARRDEIGAVSFARGYRLVPLAEDTLTIRPPWIKFWDQPAEPDRVILSVDPAVSDDPRADCSALVVLAQCGNEIRCMQAIARRLAAPELVNLIGSVDAIWRPEVIVFEGNGGFRGVTDLMTRHASYGPKVKMVVQSANKAWRVSAFSVVVQNGTFRLMGDGRGGVDPSQQGLFDEMTTFPVGEHDDLLDAAATGTAFLAGQREPRVFCL